MYFHLFTSVQALWPQKDTKVTKLTFLFCVLCAFSWLKSFCTSSWLERNGLLSPELKFAVFVEFGFGLLAARDGDDVIENAFADCVDRFGAVDYAARREIEIVGHTFEHGCV